MLRFHAYMQFAVRAYKGAMFNQQITQFAHPIPPVHNQPLHIMGHPCVMFMQGDTFSVCIGSADNPLIVQRHLPFLMYCVRMQMARTTGSHIS